MKNKKKIPESFRLISEILKEKIGNSSVSKAKSYARKKTINLRKLIFVA